ncbi:hypothetical protein PILCRDRAFT_812142 [Piloderma croceum F 1598]|uniref:Uncharacterized protein n=1 Tax=Piloderma croceum (strain F 1598) TaxID=765440 RepID=A0A0C3GFE4_PILCF|nr:hypothetical protein PILCRDRAFT_812142 [Piloderma croceum F 1598]
MSSIFSSILYLFLAIYFYNSIHVCSIDAMSVINYLCGIKVETRTVYNVTKLAVEFFP